MTHPAIYLASMLAVAFLLAAAIGEVREHAEFARERGTLSLMEGRP
jgi:hypothetical protein